MSSIVESSPRAPRATLLLAAALALTAVVYSNAPAGGFVWDDRLLIERGALIRQGASVSDLFVKPFWDQSEADAPLAVYYRPLTTLSYVADARFSGGTPAWFHLVNVLLHLGSVALVFLLARRAGAGAAAAGLAAACFGLAPRLTESVAWISGRTDLLATLLALAAVALHRPGREALLHRVAAGGLILLGLLAKEVAIAAPAGIAIVAVARARGAGRSPRGVVAELVPSFTAVVAYAALRIAAMADVREQPIDRPLLARLVNGAEALATYPLMLLDALRPRLQIGELDHPNRTLAVVGAGVAVAVAVLAVRWWRSGPRPEIAGAVAMAGTALLLVLHLVPIRVNVVAADRFLYLPLAAIAIATAGAASRWPPARRRAGGAAALLLVPALGVATWQRVQDWNDEERLWREAVRTTPPTNFLPVHELANVLFRAGRFEEALPLYERAHAQMTTARERIVEVGNVAATLSELGQLDRARAITAELAVAEPGVALHRYNLGVIEARRLDFAAAERELREALRIYPDYRAAAATLGRLEALRADAATLSPEQPDDPTPLRARRADLFARLGRDRDAERLHAEVARAADATAEQALDAARFLLRRGPTPDGERALALAARLGADPAAVRALGGPGPR